MKDFLIVVAVLAVIALLWYEGGGGDGSDTSSGDDGGSSSDDPNQTGVAGIASALAGFENVDPSHNNPGGICGDFDGGVCQGPATYDTYDEGLAAEEANIQKYLNVNPSITVAQFVQKWSGGTGLVLQNYINSVAGALGLDSNEPIGDAVK